MEAVCPEHMQSDGGLLGSGVYCLIFAGEVVYVGKAKTMLSRINTHRQNLLASRKRGVPLKGSQRPIPFSSFWWQACPLEDCDVLEARLIAKHRPRYNLNLKPEHKVSLEEAGFDYTRLGVTTVQATPRFVRRI